MLADRSRNALISLNHNKLAVQEADAAVGLGVNAPSHGSLTHTAFWGGVMGTISWEARDDISLQISQDSSFTLHRAKGK